MGEPPYRASWFIDRRPAWRRNQKVYQRYQRGSVYPRLREVGGQVVGLACPDDDISYVNILCMPMRDGAIVSRYPMRRSHLQPLSIAMAYNVASTARVVVGWSLGFDDGY